MKKLAAALLMIPAWSAAQIPAAIKPTQASSGNCSPNIISSGSGPVTVQLTGSCTGVDPRLVQQLTESLQKFLAQLPKLAADQRTVTNLNDFLAKKDVELADKVQEVKGWMEKYRELEQRLQQQPADDELSKRAGDALKEGNLNRTEALLKELLAKEEKQVDRTARNHFNLAEVYDLRFQPLLALPEYEKAYQYRPQDFSYAYAYALILYKQNRHPEAEPVYLTALRNARNLPAVSATYLPAVASTLNNLGNLYIDTQRFNQAEAAYTECLTIRQQLAKENSGAYLPAVARTLNNLGRLYGDTQRFKEAETAYVNCLAIYEQLAQERPAAYLPDVAMTLNNLVLNGVS